MKTTRGLGEAIFILASLIALAVSCARQPLEENSLRILATTESKIIAPLIESCYNDSTVDFVDSITATELLSSGAVDYDVFMPASNWSVALGDTQRLIALTENTSKSYTTLWVATSVYNQLGWEGKDIYMADVVEAMKSKRLKVATTQVGISDSATVLYFASLYSAVGNPSVLTLELLDDPEIETKLKEYFSLLAWTSESSTALVDRLIKDYPNTNAMFNYESLGIMANRELINQGKEPMMEVMVLDALAQADFPVTYIDHGDETKLAMYETLRDCILSDEGQLHMLSVGRRAAQDSFTNAYADRNIFSPAWGVQLEVSIPSARIPGRDVIVQALNLYRVGLKQPAVNIFCLDYSGSMSGIKEIELESAMGLLLDQKLAAKSYLQRGPEDVTGVMLFDRDLRNNINQPGYGDNWVVEGNDPDRLNFLLANLVANTAGGGTNMYECVSAAIQYISELDTNGKSVSIIVMSDGESGNGFLRDVERSLSESGLSIPIYGVGFNLESNGRRQLQGLVDLTNGSLYLASDANLSTELRKATGNN